MTGTGRETDGVKAVDRERALACARAMRAHVRMRICGGSVGRGALGEKSPP